VHAAWCRSGPPTLEPLSHAEATVELLRYSKNPRRFLRSGLDPVRELLEAVSCFVLAA
jgi:hypothetical protein